MTHLPHSTRRRLASGLVAAATVAALLARVDSVAPATAPAPTIARTGDGGEPRRERRGRGVGAGHRVAGRARTTSELQCATYAVPLDYRHPEAGTVRLAVNRLPANGTRSDRLALPEPRRPGRVRGGLAWRASPRRPRPKALRQHFDLVGFDPRGTNRQHSQHRVRAGRPARCAASTRPWVSPGPRAPLRMPCARAASSRRAASSAAARSCRSWAPSTPPATWTGCARPSATTGSATSGCPTAPTSVPCTPTCSRAGSVRSPWTGRSTRSSTATTTSGSWA